MKMVMEPGFQDLDDVDDVASWKLRRWAATGLVLTSWDRPLGRNPKIEVGRMKEMVSKGVNFPGK